MPCYRKQFRPAIAKLHLETKHSFSPKERLERLDEAFSQQTLHCTGGDWSQRKWRQEVRAQLVEEVKLDKWNEAMASREERKQS